MAPTHKKLKRVQKYRLTFTLLYFASYQYKYVQV